MNIAECVWCGEPALERALVRKTPLCGAYRCRRQESEALEWDLRHEDEEHERLQLQDVEVIRPAVLN